LLSCFLGFHMAKLNVNVEFLLKSDRQRSKTCKQGFG
jgi:hypothetical protein